MTKFIELELVIPVISSGNLVGVELRKIFVNADNISHFQSIQVMYPQKISEENLYYFHENISTDKEVLEKSKIWDNTVLGLRESVRFENLYRYHKECISLFNNMSFKSGSLIHFKSGVSPLDNDKPVYAITSVDKLVKHED